MPVYRTAETLADLQGILQLQHANLSQTIGPHEAREQGFVTLQHTLPLLREMNADYGHSIAVEDEQVVGYALMMQRRFETQIPALAALMQQLDHSRWRGRPLTEYPYFIMGQVCVAKAFRGQGVFVGLYQHLCTRLAADFAVVVTEIAALNTRSCRAHAKIGFVEMQRYLAKDGREWVVVGKDCRE
jgi:GNAT superfamily N-acetyltransferase